MPLPFLLLLLLLRRLGFAIVVVVLVDSFVIIIIIVVVVVVVVVIWCCLSLSARKTQRLKNIKNSSAWRLLHHLNQLPEQVKSHCHAPRFPSMMCYAILPMLTKAPSDSPISGHVTELAF